METTDPAALEAMLGEARRQNRMREQATDGRVVALEAEVAKLTEERDTLGSGCDLYSRGYHAMHAADISEYLALCGSVRQLEADLAAARGANLVLDERAAGLVRALKTHDCSCAHTCENCRLKGRDCCHYRAFHSALVEYRDGME